MLKKYVVLEDITNWVDEGSQVDIIYTLFVHWFTKAFDKVPHQRLLLKLKAHGLLIVDKE